MTDDFFTAFEERLRPAAPAAVVPADPAPARRPSRRRRRNAQAVVADRALLVAAVIYFMLR